MSLAPLSQLSKRTRIIAHTFTIRDARAKSVLLTVDAEPWATAIRGPR
ncbi:MAG TPA: hypothetical protein VGV93_04840 [Acidimicrobiales bacterium]|nr:hypothetical protein [Acidimicrobiales bacterium]